MFNPFGNIRVCEVHYRFFFFFEDLILLPHFHFSDVTCFEQNEIVCAFDISLTVSPSWVTATCPKNEDD